MLAFCFYLFSFLSVLSDSAHNVTLQVLFRLVTMLPTNVFIAVIFALYSFKMKIRSIFKP
jgi:hypothetical protein